MEPYSHFFLIRLSCGQSGTSLLAISDAFCMYNRDGVLTAHSKYWANQQFRSTTPRYTTDHPFHHSNTMFLWTSQDMPLNRPCTSHLRLAGLESGLTSFPLAPPPSNSISNMGQILGDTVDISLDSAVDQEDGVAVRADPIVLIEDYIPVCGASKKRVSTFSLRRLLFEIADRKKLRLELASERGERSESKERSARNPSGFSRKTYNSVKSVRSVPQIRQARNKRSLMCLNRAIQVLHRDGEGPVAEEDAVLDPKLFTEFRHGLDADWLGCQLSTLMMSPVDQATPQPTTVSLHSRARLGLAMSEALWGHGLDSPFYVSLTSTPPSVRKGRALLETSLKYCVVCDKPLYELSAWVQEARQKFRIFVCSGCADKYNEIVTLLEGVDFEAASETSSQHSSGLLGMSRMSLDAEDQLVSLAEHVALEMADALGLFCNTSLMEDGSLYAHKNARFGNSVGLYEKILKLYLLMHEVDPEEQEDDVSESHGDETTDIGNESAVTLALDPEAGFKTTSVTTQVNTRNILQDVGNQSVGSIQGTLPLPKQRQKNGSFQEYYRSLITKPSTTRLVLDGKENVPLVRQELSGFSLGLVGLLHRQLETYEGVTKKKSFFERYWRESSGVPKGPELAQDNGKLLAPKASLLNLNLEQEWSALKKKIRWRWRIKGLVPGLEIRDH